MLSRERMVHPDALEVHEFSAYPNQNAIWDMTADPAGRVYIGLCNEGEPGHAAKLLSYEIARRQVEECFDVAEATHDPSWLGHIPQSKFHTALHVGRDGRLYGPTHTTAPAFNRPIWDIEQAFDERDIAYPGSHYLIYDPRTCALQDLGIPVPYDPIYGGIYDDQRGVHYLLTYLRGRLYAFEPAAWRVRDLGRVNNFGQCILFKDRHGRVFGVESSGHLWRYDPDRDKVETLNAVMPRPAERARLLTALTDGMWGPDGKYYSSALYEGRLWRYDPDDGPEGRFEDLGMGWGEATAERHQNLLWCPKFAPDGMLYYGFATYGGAKHCRYFDLRIVRCDPRTLRRENMGVVYHNGSSLLFGAGAVGADGRIYWGDGCRFGRPAALVIFDPAKVGAPGPVVALTAKPETQQSGAGAAREEHLARLAQRSGDCATDAANFRLIPLFRELLPRGECAITVLAAFGKGIYAGASGNACRILRVDGKPRIVYELPRPGRVTALAADADALHAAIVHDDSSTLLSIVPGEEPTDNRTLDDQVLALAAGPGECTLLTAGGRLLRWRPGKAPEPLADLPEPPCPVLAKDGDGTLWGSIAEGFLFRFDPRTGNLELLEKRIPASRGSHYMAAWESAALAPDGFIYGGTNEGYLFRLDPAGGKVINLGKPSRAPGLRALTVAGDGAVYGVTGAPAGLARIVRYHPDDGFTDLGRPSLPEPTYWKGHRFATAIAHGNDIYFGEDDDEGHLWVLRRRNDK